MTKLETILKTKKILVCKLVSIIVKWFINWYLKTFATKFRN